jgi:hypothetical protein
MAMEGGCDGKVLRCGAGERHQQAVSLLKRPSRTVTVSKVGRLQIYNGHAVFWCGNL